MTYNLVIFYMVFVKYYKLVEVWIEFPLWGRLAVFGGAQFLPFVSHRIYGLPVNSSLETSISTIHAALAWIGHAPAPPWPDAAHMTRFDDSDDFLLSHRAFDFPFYVVCLEQQGVPGLDLIRLIRRRNNAGILAISNQEGEGFVSALEAGADMVLRRDAPEDHLQAAILAIQRRSGPGAQAAAQAPWRLLEEQSILQAPDGTRISLGDSDLAVMRCFAHTEGGRVARRALIESLWGDGADDMDNALHVTLYRLRKRIEQAGQPLVPVHSVSKVGYEFRAPLVRE